ncbi:NHL repeat-containing 2 [Brachionus plicatilis]|uniref:NHL repeat-containing 2 n=1 Tax=Brachionus plicatilis TaxID=10195 RepID=A0A3M7QBX7_BRAPC|nr:NHL repeat-containing 2 [Brachionus plicatilis]
METLRFELYQNLISLLANSCESELEAKIFDYLSSLDSYQKKEQLDNHSKKLKTLKELEWLNTSKKIDITSFNDKLVLVDFWTYCCINCLHVLPLLKRIQSEFPQLVSLGCHSSKFSNEKSKNNILSALKRHLISHPIACDSNLDIWNNLGIICWPTLLVLNPDGLIIGEFIGEVNCNYLKKFIQISSKFYEKKLSSRIIQFDQGYQFNQPSKLLSFPTKLTFSPELDLLLISDSGNNRVLGFDVNQKNIKLEISSHQCFENSIFIKCCLNWLQGIVYDHDLKTIIVADTFNNMIKSVNLESKEIKVLCGVEIGNRIGLFDFKGGKKGPDQEISSPWDLKLMKKDNSKILLIACAGTHQIWLYSFQNTSIDHQLKSLTWWRNINVEWERLVCVAGNGKERNKNNAYPLHASFAQPSGLCFDNNYNCYIADAESSTVRAMNLQDGSVKGFIGGDNLDPDNLFAYGDKDGKGYEAKLQHPLDICFLKDKYLIVADAFNNSLKLIDIQTKFCRKICTQGAALNEPSGICVDEKNGYIWIADTNNHSIKFVKIGDIFEQKKVFLNKSGLDSSMDTVDSVERIVGLKIGGQMYVNVEFDFKLNEAAENLWILKGLFRKSESVHRIWLGDFDKIISLEIQLAKKVSLKDSKYNTFKAFIEINK